MAKVKKDKEYFLNKYGYDPFTCDLDFLKKEVTKYKDDEDYWNTMQLSAKRFINSVYGVFGSDYFNLANVDIAESITLQGQDLIKFSVKAINKYFKEKWPLDIEGHKRTSALMLEDYPDFDAVGFEEKAATNSLIFNTLQIYGDSCVGDALIETPDGRMKIEDMFNEVNDEGDVESKLRVCSNRKVYVYSPDEYKCNVRDIAYIMRHKTNKKIYRITSLWGDHVDVTEDHSVIVVRRNEVLNVKPNEIDLNFDDLILFIGSAGFDTELCGIKSIELLCNGTENYVYDIAVKTDDEGEHNFFANKICVHNTDSVSGDTMIRTQNHPEGIKISDFYEENSSNIGDTTKAGHESVNTLDKSLNAIGGELVYSPIERIIRHKVNKPKWRIKTSSGKEVICTSDHSLIVIRDGKQIVIKPNELKSGDKMITLK